MALVHIGLHKTASTSLQNYWESLNDINLNWGNLDKLVSAIRHMVGNGTTNLELNTDALGLNSDSGASATIYSHEGLSTYVFGQQCSRQQVFDFRQLAAFYMEKLAPDSSVLIVTREPVSWITSIYKQYVQEGGHRSLQNFLLTEKDFLAESLSLRNLVDIWSAYFPRERIILLPFEMLKNEQERFLSEVREKACIDMPTEDISFPRVNVSISDNDLALLLKINRWFKLLIDNTGIGTSLLIDEVRKKILPNLRLELQYDKQELSRLAAKLAFDLNDDAKLPDSVTQSIVEDNLLFLQNEYDDYYGYLPQYLAHFSG